MPDSGYGQNSDFWNLPVIAPSSHSTSRTPSQHKKARMKFAINANFIRALSFRRSFFQISNFWSFSRFSDRSSKIQPTVASNAKRHFARAGETPAILQYHECWPFDLFPSAIILTGRIKRWNKPRHSCMIFGYSSGSIFRP